MRHLLLALLIAVLPVRGWVGHAMAVDMASQQAVLAQAAATGAPTAMPEDCPMHAQMTDAAAGPAEAPQTGMLCEGCDTVSWLPHAAPANGGSRFSSADQPSGIKPPIS
jgi:hypothetical protein